MRKDKVQNVEKMMMEQGQSPKKNSGPIWVLGSRRKEHGELFSIQLVPGSQASTSRAQRGVKALSSVLADAAGKNNQVEACLRRRIAKYQVVCGTGRKNSKCVGKKTSEVVGYEKRRGENVVVQRVRLLLHPSEEGIVVLLNASAAARVRLAVVFLIGKVIVVHFDILALAVVTVAVAHAGLLRRHGSAS